MCRPKRKTLATGPLESSVDSRVPSKPQSNNIQETDKVRSRDRGYAGAKLRGFRTCRFIYVTTTLLEKVIYISPNSII